MMLDIVHSRRYLLVAQQSGHSIPMWWNHLDVFERVRSVTMIGAICMFAGSKLCSRSRTRSPILVLASGVEDIYRFYNRFYKSLGANLLRYCYGQPSEVASTSYIWTSNSSLL